MKQRYLHLASILFALFFTHLNAQHRCATDEIYQGQYDQDPALRAAEKADRDHYLQALKEMDQQRSANGAKYIIPVVVHVLHLPDSAPGQATNPTDARILDQIRIMNEDFRAMPNTNGDGDGPDTQIEFRLAAKDPNGNCHTGINRVPWAGTHNILWTDSTTNANFKRLSYWPRQRFLNLWVVGSSHNGAVGWANFPWNTGTPARDSLDGICVIDSAFGNTAHASFGLGHTATHEAGHWLGLWHTFQPNSTCKNDTCTIDGDQVCDTPPQQFSTPVWHPCNVTRNTCDTDTLSGFTADQNDMIENFMDYSQDPCMNRFTEGQRTRMVVYLNGTRASVWSDSNRVFTGVKGLLHDFDSVGVAAGLNGKVTAMAEWESEGKLVITGSFTEAAGMAVPGICTWDGTNFDTIPGAPTFDNLSNQATSIAIFKNNLYIGGTFSFWGTARYLIRYNGAAWESVTTNGDWQSTSHPVRAMQVYKGKLYVGGDFGQVNGNTVNANRVAAWDGSAWAWLGTSSAQNGLYGSVPACYAMTIHDGKLALGGRFDTGDNVASDKVILWNGSAFSSINVDTDVVYSGSVNSLGSYEGKLYAGGDYYSVGGKLRQFFSGYDGTTWKDNNVAGGVNCLSIEPYNGYVWIGGAISALNMNGEDTYGLFTYDAAKDTFYNVTDQSTGMNSTVRAMEVYKGELYVGGEFDKLNGNSVGSPISFDHIVKVKTYCVDPPVGVEEAMSTTADCQVRAFPNPTSGQVNFELKGEWMPGTKVQVEVMDLMGKVVKRAQFAAQPRLSMRLGGLAKGTYLYRVRGEFGEVATGRIVVMR